jgi:hypothetical protein
MRTASNCTACGDSQNGLQGSLSLGASIGASLKKKILGVEDALFSVTFAVSSDAPDFSSLIHKRYSMLMFCAAI